MDILIKGATIITQNKNREIRKGDIHIQNNRIAEIEKNINEKAEFKINANGKLAMPGLINMHTHVSMALFRGYGEGLPLERWLNEKIWPMEKKQTKEDAYIAAKISMCEMIRSGTTAFNDMCLLGAKEIGKAANEAGIRAHISQGLFDLLPGRGTERELKSMKAGAYRPSGLVSYGIAPHSVYTCSKELLQSALAFSKKKKLKIHTHAAETRKEVFDLQKRTKKRVFEYFDDLGYLGPNSMFAHAGWVTKSEIQLAAKSGSTIITNPVSNLKLATGGICPVSEFDKAGANVCIGTDSVASNNSLNMLESMKLTALLQKHRYWNPNIIGPQRILDFATLNGAKALGIDCGRIEPGALADIVLLELGPNMVPAHDHVTNIIYSANPSNVSGLIVNGKIIMENRKMLAFDEEITIMQAQSLSNEIMKR